MHENLFEKILRNNCFYEKIFFFIKDKTDIKNFLRRKSPIFTKKYPAKKIKRKKFV